MRWSSLLLGGVLLLAGLVPAVQARQLLSGILRDRIGLSGDRGKRTQGGVTGCVQAVVVSGRQVDRCVPAVVEFARQFVVAEQAGERIVDALRLDEAPAADPSKRLQAPLSRCSQCEFIFRLRPGTSSEFPGKEILEALVVLRVGALRFGQGNAKGLHPDVDHQSPQPGAFRASQTAERPRQMGLRKQVLSNQGRVPHGQAA